MDGRALAEKMEVKFRPKKMGWLGRQWNR